MKATLLLSLSLSTLLVGCSIFKGKTVKQSFTGKDGITVTNETSTMIGTSFFDAKNELNKAKVGQSPKSGQAIGVGSLSQETSGTNTVEALKYLAIILSNLPK